MKFSQAKPGRVFVLRLEDGDVLHETVERFALEHRINAASLIALGGADVGSKLVVGPKEGRAAAIDPMVSELSDVHEIAGVGTLFPDSQGKPVLHMHVAAGREDGTVTGCVRKGVKTWHVLEIVLWELIGTGAKRMKDPTTGFELLQP